MRGSVNHSRKMIKRAIYDLKYKFGYEMGIYTTVKGDYNPETGTNPSVTTKITIQRGIAFPSTVQRNFFFSISVIQANSRFIQGGDIQLDDRQFIIDGDDLPRGHIINIDDYLIWDHQRYDLKTAQALEYGTGWVLVGRKIQGATTGEIHEYQLEDYLTVFDSYSSEVIRA